MKIPESAQGFFYDPFQFDNNLLKMIANYY